MLLMAFLLQNDLIRNHDIVFFTDGAKCIQDGIKKYFSGHRYVSGPYFFYSAGCRPASARPWDDFRNV